MLTALTLLAKRPLTPSAKPEKTEVSDNAESKVEVKKEDNITASEVVEAAKSTEIVSKDDATTDKISQEVTNSATVTVKGKDVAIGSTEAAEAAKGCYFCRCDRQQQKL